MKVRNNCRACALLSIKGDALVCANAYAVTQPHKHNPQPQCGFQRATITVGDEAALDERRAFVRRVDEVSGVYAPIRVPAQKSEAVASVSSSVAIAVVPKQKPKSKPKPRTHVSRAKSEAAEKRKETAERHEIIAEMYREGKTTLEVSAATGLSRDWLQTLRRKLAAEGKCGPAPRGGSQRGQGLSAQIVDMLKQGVPYQAIAEKVGCSRANVKQTSRRYRDEIQGSQARALVGG